MMNTADELRKRIEDADEMADLLDHPAFQKAITAIDHEIHEQWRFAETVEKREQVHADYRALQRLIQCMRAVISDGKIAKAEAAAAMAITQKL